MIDIKDKTITAESLKLLHEYNKEIYASKDDIVITSNTNLGKLQLTMYLKNIEKKL
jgi:hypothetical protein